jgi:hypothetical protein
MTSRVRALRPVAPLLVGVGATVALVGGPAHAQSGRCAPGTGVTVVVDYGPLGGGTQVGCDPGGAGQPASQVVPAAGFSLTFVNGEPFVCRIDGKPGSSAEGCQRTPPADAYWGLFWSDGTSGTWTYASVGVGSLKVPAGGFIGWRFQDGSARANPGTAPVSPRTASSPTPQPSASSSATRRATSTPTPAQKPTPSRTPAATRSGSPATPAFPRATVSRHAPSSRPSAGASRAKPVSKSPSPSRAPSTTSAAAVPSATGSASALPSGADVDLTSGEQARKSSGPGLAIIAGGLLVALAVAAGTLAWRRRGV